MTAPRGLHTLARLHGVQTAYYDNDGRRITASPESLQAALRGLRVDVSAPERIPRHVQERQRELWERAVQPVVVAWTGSPDGLARKGRFLLRTRGRLRDAAIRVSVVLEEGGERVTEPAPDALEVTATESVGGADYVERHVPLPPVPVGYHDLIVDVGTGRTAQRHRALLITAPRRAPGWDVLPASSSRLWGLFAPLYALWQQGQRDGPDEGGDPSLTLLSGLAERVEAVGGNAVGTLPLLAAFLDEPYEPSPYAPVSRLFWNELYVAPTPTAGGETLRATPRSSAHGSRRDRYFDPRAAMRRLRPVLEREALAFFQDAAAEPVETSGGAEPVGLAAFRARNPLAGEYARFRALTEARGPWGEWPDRLRARDVRPGDYDPGAARYHLYAQWRAERQLAEVAERAESRGVALYLDLPLGVHSDGFDVWRHRALFADGVSAGAPPDPLARGGQDWGFPPAHPEASRLDGHAYFISSIRNHLRFARVLRIDHVMQLERMFWVPGGDARQGVYVRYPAEELYAVLSLEAHRAGAVIVGEDLGTVPRSVRRGMKKHGLPGMYVLQFELAETGGPGGGGPLRPRDVPAAALASVGTHDTPTFAGWWWGRDIEIRRELGHLTEEQAAAELEGRAVMREKLVRGLGLADGPGSGTSPASVDSGRRGGDLAVAVHEELLLRMGRSEAGLVLATMEDLWLEPEPQNVPGTTSDTNWRRRSARPLEALADGEPERLMRALNASREGIG